MPEIHELTACIEKIAPPELAKSWDNSGLLVNTGREVTHVLVTLDITPAVVAEAAALGCEMIVAHHPVILAPLKNITSRDVPALLLQSGVSALCAHTNWDAAHGGINDVLAGLLGICEAEPLGFGRVGRLPAALCAADFAALCAAKLSAPVRLADAGRPVQRIALAGGSGADLLSQAVLAGADCLLTGDAGHHTALDAIQAGLSLVAAGHYATEWPGVEELAHRLAQECTNVRVSLSTCCKNPFSQY